MTNILIDKAVMQKKINDVKTAANLLSEEKTQLDIKFRENTLETMTSIETALTDVQSILERY